MTTANIQQQVEGTDRENVHIHPAVVHVHDHYHVSHHHRAGVAGVVGEFEHRAYWHTHSHNHLALTHGHEYDHDDEVQEHAREGHIHDHAAPCGVSG
jgi:hypothetical protein